MPKELQKRLGQFFRTFQSIWGMIFRTFFIFMLGITAYRSIGMYDIEDTTLARIPLNDIMRYYAPIAAIILCAVWFFRFPNRDHENDPDPYIVWAHASYLFMVVLVAFFIFYYLKIERT